MIAAAAEFFVGNPWTPSLEIQKYGHGIEHGFDMLLNTFVCEACENVRKRKEATTKLVLEYQQKIDSRPVFSNWQSRIRSFSGKSESLPASAFRITQNPTYRQTTSSL